MKIQYNGKSKILLRLVELVNRSQNVALRQDTTDKHTLYWTGLDGVETTFNIPSGAMEIDTELSEVSTNPVQNRAVTGAVSQKADRTDLEETAADLRQEIDQKANKADIPTIGDATLTVNRNGTKVGTFSANAMRDTEINITVPTKATDLDNDAGYLTRKDIAGKLDKTGDSSDTTVKFSIANNRTNISTGERLSALFGKIAKLFVDLKAVAFSGSYNDLLDKPSAATQSAQGLMSAADKAKLDSVATGANKTTVDSALSSTSTNPVQNKVVNTAIEKTFQLRGRVVDSTDWNTITEAGCYKVQISNWGDAETLHSPNGYISNLYSYGLLFVIKSYNDTTELRTSQVYIPHSLAPQIVTRMHNSSSYANGWKTWSSPVCTPASHTHNYLPLSGGTMTGSINSTKDDFLVSNANGYKVFFRNDGSKMWMLVSDKGGATWNDYRPFALQLSTGVVDISGNAKTATKLQTARTINGVAFNGTANINVPLQQCFYYDDSSTWGTTPWHKIASTTLTHAYEDKKLVLLVSRGFADNAPTGILRLKVRSNANKLFESGSL